MGCFMNTTALFNAVTSILFSTEERARLAELGLVINEIRVGVDETNFCLGLNGKEWASFRIESREEGWAILEALGPMEVPEVYQSGMVTIDFTVEYKSKMELIERVMLWAKETGVI